jgi:Zn-dependent M28 family amino/carboxypeptidase
MIVHISGSQTHNIVFIKDVKKFEKLLATFSSQWSRFNPRSVHVGFVVDKVALGQIFSEYFSSLAYSPTTTFSISSTSIIWSNYNGPYTALGLRDSVSSWPKNK